MRPASEQAIPDEIRIDDGWRLLVGVLDSRDGRHRQDPADYLPRLPEFRYAGLARGKAPDPVLRTELVRARNRLEGALLDVLELSGAARARGK